MKAPLISLHEISQQLTRREVSSREVVQQCLDRINATNSQVNAYIHLQPESALNAANAVDERRAAGESLSPLAGIPIGIKDVLCCTEMPTTCGSKILENYRSPFDSSVVASLKRDNAIILGKTNLDEFAMGGSTETSIFGPSRNPWAPDRTCGGSSGGSAAVVAAGYSPGSIGTDTGGSIRQPAAFCGVCGLKPTYGRVSRYGLVAYGSSLDQAGPFGHTVADVAMLLQSIAGHDDRDSTSLDIAVPSFTEPLQASPKGMTIGVIREHLDGKGLDPEIHASLLAAIDVYKSLGVRIVDISLPHTKYSISTYYIIAPCEASSNLSRFDGAHYGFRAPKSTVEKPVSDNASALVQMYSDSRSQGFGAEVRRRIMLGTYALSSGYYNKYYLKALQVRRLIRQDYDNAFESVDVLLGPTTPTPAFPLGDKVNDPVQMYLEDLFTVGANLAGIPAMSIPIGTTNASKLPIGMQLQSAPLTEAKLITLGHAYQAAVGFTPSLPSASDL